jgi:hypothetical protein
MSQTAGASGAAYDAQAQTGEAVARRPGDDPVVLRQRADEADAAVEAIEAKMSGWKQSLADAKAAAKEAHRRLREAEGN